jgi:flagellar hook-basal body complex protein FliE
MDTSGIDHVLAQLRATSAMAAGVTNPASNASAAGVDFGAVLKSALEQVNGAGQEAGKLAMQFEQGAPNVELHDVMISLQKADVSFQAMVQVRNKLVSAYRDIMNMQV